jgi:hypothetical protein
MRKPSCVRVVADKQGAQLMTTVGNRDKVGDIRQSRRWYEDEDVEGSLRNLQTRMPNHVEALLFRKKLFATRPVDEHGDFRRGEFSSTCILSVSTL